MAEYVPWYPAIEELTQHVMVRTGIAGDRRWQSAMYERRRLRICAEEAVGQVLDLGHAQFPNPYLVGSRTTGLDLLLPTFPSQYHEDLVGSVMEIKSLLAERQFDTVIAGELIEHLEQPYDFLRSIREVLRPDGRLVLSTPNPIGFPTLFFEIIRSHRWFYTSDHTFYLLPRWVERMLDRTGYELERIRRVGFWLPVGFIPWCPVWCSYQLVYVARLRR